MANTVTGSQTPMTEAPNDTGSEIVSDLIENAGVRYTLVTLHVIAIVLSSLGNGFLIVFIARHWRQTHRNVTAILILNLAACDFINAICYQPMRLVDILVSNEDRLTFCQVSGFFSAFFAGVGFMSMVVIAEERFLLICHPFRAKRLLTLRNTMAVMLVIWLGVMLCAIPIPIASVYVIEVHLSGGVARFCLVDLSVDGRFRGDVYFGCLFVLFFLLPLAVVTFCYVRIFRTLRHGFPGQKRAGGAALRVLRQRQSLAKVMLSTAVIFVVSQGPHWITFLISACGYEIKNNPIFTLLFVDLLAMVSPSLNPIVYSIRFSTVRKGITRSGGSIYNVLRRVSLQKNSSSLVPPPGGTPIASLVRECADSEVASVRSGDDDVDDGTCLADGRSTFDCDHFGLTCDRNSCCSQPQQADLKQTILTSNGKVLRYSVSFV